MDTQVIAANLVRLRKDRGVTQEDVAEAAGLSRAAYRAVEKGRSMPRVENLRALASALEVPLRDLVTPVPRLDGVRFRSLKRLKRRDQVLVAVARWLQDFNDLEALLGLSRPDGLQALWSAVAIQGEDRARSMAMQARHCFDLDEKEPVHDICGLLSSKGVKVHVLEVASDAFLGLSVGPQDGGPAVVVNVWPRLAVEHWIFSAVHELGHLILHQGAYDVRLEEEEPNQEKEAETFASHFLMPDVAFLREWRETAGLPLIDRVIKVKRVFRVSWRVVLYRVALDLPEDWRAALWKRMYQDYKARTGRVLYKLTEPESVVAEVFGDPSRLLSPTGSEPAALDAHDFQEGRLAWMVRLAVEKEIITLARGAEILGLGLDEIRERAASWIESE